ncbi:hypothetical protein ELI38_20405 [Rhizobium leguminosarum]|uniref:hypothetical protein n=1 Tax=Rhizobium leguminosarum TaxID=384 RepID=UPI001030F7ED|nr:hypothetical protein [Rhizobium leguminosarum]TAU98168.1 hypothetical protein ELI38_20405 [Rhizobium leguminosarum]
MTDVIVWPGDLLVPGECRPNLVPFTRSGGRSLGGVQRSIRTDLGFWSVEYRDVPLYGIDKMRTYEAIKDILSGSSGRIAVPIYSPERTPWVNGLALPPSILPHDDDTFFSDGTGYRQGAISIVSVAFTPLAATIMQLRIISGDTSLSGTLFSYNHALYRIGQTLEVAGDVYTVRISPTVREAIPAGADLEFDRPTCLCNLIDDRSMDNGSNMTGFERVGVSFNEDTDYWNQLALGLI